MPQPSTSIFVLDGEGLQPIGPQPVPTHCDGLDVAWLRQVFEGVGMPGLTGATCLDPIVGTATKMRMGLDWGGRDGPARIMVKGGFSEHRLRMSYIYAHEARFFREIAGQLDIIVPRCLATAEDPAARQYLVMLEDLDLSATRYCRVTHPLSRSEAEAFLDVMARLHARFWNDAAFETGGAFETVNRWQALPTGARGAYLQGQLRPETYRDYAAMPRGLALPQRFHDPALMRAAMERATLFGQERPWCLVHGDFHLGNLYFTAEGRPGVLDWQTWSRGHWAHDLTYFLISALDMLDRRRWVEDLIGHYLERLALHGVVDPPSHRAAMEAFRVHIPYGLCVWLVNPAAFQAEANNCAVAPRFALAAIDHGAFDDL
ncbi:phosphotransferase family protein [Sphingomonas sp. 2378]|uniref:phosphotransferase family protein n=1 Tax=Sphingomonas sp. 2378 TaxID=1219748 RepID=UPI00311AC6D7